MHHLHLDRFLPDEPGDGPIKTFTLRGIKDSPPYLHLGHMADLNPIEDIHTLLDGVDLVAVEICGTLLKLGEVLHRTQAALGTVDMLIKDAAQADRVEALVAFMRQL
jgi:hypothetical protein